MARGLLPGAVLLGAIALFCALFSSFAPLWLIVRIEASNRLCWRGEGMWIAGLRWGDIGLVEEGLDYKSICTNPPLLSTFEAYCATREPRPPPGGPVEQPWERMSDGDREETCEQLKVAKSFSTVSIVALALSIAVGLATQGLRRAGSGVFSPRALGLARAAAVLAAVGGICYLVAAIVMLESPLLRPPHFAESLNDPSIEDTGCFFQNPLSNLLDFKRLLSDSPLNCVFLGPSFALALVAVVTALLASAVFIVLARDMAAPKCGCSAERNLHPDLNPNQSNF